MQTAITIEIGQQTFSQRPMSDETCAAVVARLLARLGIAAAVQTSFTSNPVFLTVNGLPCDFPAWLPAQVNEYMLLPGGPTTDTTFWEILLVDILWRQPTVLLPAGLAAAYFHMPLTGSSLQNAATEQHCREILEALLNLHISLAIDTKETAASRNAFLYNDLPQWDAFREELIDRFSGNEIVIYCHPAYFKQVIRAGAASNMFEQLRADLLNETGIAYPDFRIQYAEDLPLQAFRFGMNQFVSVPYTGLQGPEELLVNASSAELPGVMIIREQVNPVNGGTHCVINNAARAAAEDKGFIAVNAPAYFLFCFDAFLRRHAGACIIRQLLTQSRDATKYPELFAMGDSFSAARSAMLKSVLRLLVKEGLPVKYTGLISEAVLEADCMEDDRPENIILDDRVPVLPGRAAGWKEKAENRLSFVRMRLRDYITPRYVVLNGSLLVYQTDWLLESLLQEGTPPAASVLQIRVAIEKEMGNLPPGAQLPVIMTSTPGARLPLKNILEPRFPQVVVLYYKELAPSVQPQTIAVIKL